MKELVPLFKNKLLLVASGFFLVSFTAFFITIEKSEHWAYFAAGLSVGLVIAVLSRTPINGIDRGDNSVFEASEIVNEHKQLLDALEIINDGFVLFDKDQKLVVANEKIRDLFDGMGTSFENGDDRADIATAAYNWFEDGSEKEHVKGILSTISNKLMVPRENFQLVLPNGKHVVINEQFIHDHGIVTIIRDITEQNLKQQELEDRSQLLKTVFENVPIGISVYDSEHRILSWNEKYLEIMEIKQETIFSGMAMLDLLKSNFEAYLDVGDDPEEFALSVMESIELSLYTKVERRTKSGKFIEIFRTVLPDGSYICTFTDVTLTRSAQLVLQESEVRYRKMVELSPDAILVQKDGLVIFANVAAINLLGINDLHGLIGAHVRKFFPINDLEKLQGHFGSSDHMSAGDNVPSVTTQVIQNGGTRIDVEIEATALLYGDRPVMQLIVRDISAQTKTQILLQKAKDEAVYASQLKGTFLANMSHELRTPLNAVIGFSEIIKNQIFGKVGSDKYVEYANDIHSSGKHLLDLINDILDFSKIEANTQDLYEEVVDLEKLVKDCLRLVEPQRKNAYIQIFTSFAGNLPNVIVDAKNLKQVFLNLLSNAIKFTPKGGEITIHSGLSSDGSLFVSVKDTGIGIKEEDLPKALTPFVQIDGELNRKYQGTGLGLPLSVNLMKLHGGDLKISSTYGEGTDVTITLPSARVEQSAA